MGGWEGIPDLGCSGLPTGAPIAVVIGIICAFKKRWRGEVDPEALPQKEIL